MHSPQFSLGFKVQLRSLGSSLNWGEQSVKYRRIQSARPSSNSVVADTGRRCESCFAALWARPDALSGEPRPIAMYITPTS